MRVLAVHPFRINIVAPSWFDMVTEATLPFMEPVYELLKS
jgi:hypothetical protein